VRRTRRQWGPGPEDQERTSTYTGTIYALDTQTGATLWTAKATAGINSFPAVDGDTLLVGAGTAGRFKKPKFQLIALA